MAWMGGTEGDPPMKTGFPVIDSATGMLAAFAILAGVRESERTGRGMLLDVSMATAGRQLMYPMTCDAMTTGGVPARQGNQGYSGSPSADFFRTQDGWLALGANTPKQLLALLKALELGELAQDPALFETPLDAGALPAFVRSLGCRYPRPANSPLFHAPRRWRSLRRGRTRFHRGLASHPGGSVAAHFVGDVSIAQEPLRRKMIARAC